MPRFAPLALILPICLTTTVQACPFCAAETRTLTEEINDSSVVILAKLSEPAKASEALADDAVPYGFVDPDNGSARFSVERVFSGFEEMSGVEEIEAIYFGGPDFDKSYFIRGVGEPLDWAIPLPLSEAAESYVARLFELPESGGERLAYFLEYLEHEDPLLAQDAYDEFARAPYADVIAIGDRMDRRQLLDWIEGGRVSPSRRRLFLTMLGVCGQPEDVQRIEAMLMSDGAALGSAADALAAASLSSGGPLGIGVVPEVVRTAERQRKLGLDAMIACYLTLCGKHGDPSAGLDLVDRRFLKQQGADYSHVYSALMALRFLVEEQSELVPRDRALRSARLLLDNGDFADQVIPDLARWGDWSVLDRLTAMYQSSVQGDANRYVREPIITYLDAAAERGDEVAVRALAALAIVEPLDPDAVKRARSLRAFGFLAQARSKPADSPSMAGAGVETVPSSAPRDATPAADESKPTQSLAERVAEVRAKKAAQSAAEPSAPPAEPSRILLVGAPFAGAAICLVVFWTILRGGVA